MRAADAARRFARVASALCAAALLSGCALPVQAEVDELSDVAHYATSYDHVVGPGKNLLDRALAGCSEKTVRAETACVKQDLGAAHIPIRALIALVPNCRAGQICHYDATTRDRLGFVRASATDYVKRWRIDIDLRHPAADASQVPVTVVDRDDFDAPVPGKPG